MKDTPLLYNSRITRIYLEFLKRYYPQLDTASLLRYAGMRQYEVEDPGQWFSQQQVDRFHDILVEKTGNPNVARDAGRFSASTKGIGPLRQYTLGLISPNAVYLLMEKLYPFMTRAATVKTKKIGPNKVEIVSKPKPGVIEKPYQCENRIGLFESVTKLFTGDYAKLEHPLCFHKGDGYCLYTVSWQNRPSFIWKLLRNYSILASILASIVLFFVLPIITWVLFILLCIAFDLVISFCSAHVEKKELTRTVEAQGDAAKDLLGEINTRYNNALLVQEIGQATSTILDIDRLIGTVLSAMERRLDFDRGAVMLANREKTRLLYSYGYGYSKKQENALRGAGFHLDKPESRGIFESAFREQKAFLVNDIADIEKQFSERSQELAKQIGVHSLICVPIVYEKESLGIIAVDNIEPKRLLTQTDISLLTGVASQTAMSIVNAMSFQKLQESKEKYRTILESVEEGYYEVDLAGNFTFYNDSMCKILGYSRDELMGMNNRYYTDKETAKIVYEVFNNVYKTGRPDKAFDWAVIKKDGTKRYVEISVSLMKDSGGEGIGFRGIVRDVTDRKCSEEALRESEERYKKLYDESKRAEEVYRSLLHTSADAVVIYDLEGKTKYINPAFSRIFGWTMAEVKGERIPFLPESEREATMAGVREIMGRGKAIQGFETKRLTKEGRIIDVNISGSRYHDHEGNPAGMLVVLRDTSEKKRLESQFQQAQRVEAIGTLAGGIAHDFNNLLMAIQGNTSLMLLGMDGSNPNYEMLKNIEKQVQSGARLTRQFLGYARRGKYEVKPTGLNQQVEVVSETFGRTRKEIRIHRALAEDLLSIEADQGQIEQVLLNLCVNAADAMPGGGDLFLKTTNVTHEDMKGEVYDPKPGNYVLLTFTDTGTGMDKETQEHIFDPFFTTKEMGRGTGLGLASVYGIIKGHGGYIDVASEKGRGTTFSIYLPASEKRVKKAGKRAERVVEGSGTILLVDDEAMVLDVGVKMLEHLGYRVLEAKGGKEAVQNYEANKDKIDMVILDMIMPDMDGGKAYDQMKVINPDVKVLLSSGYSIEGKATEILDRGCDGFIQKPFNLRELSGKVNDALSKQYVTIGQS